MRGQRLKHGGHLWRWLEHFWVWQTEPVVFLGLGVGLYAFFPTLHIVAALGIDVAITWVLGWRLARLDDFE